MSQESATIKPRVLCVDDDPALLDLLSRQLRSDYEVTTAPSGETALAALNESSAIAVIVADMNMPRMNGATLLAQVKKVAPTVVRVMLTGESEQAVAAQAVNTGQIFRFLVKSCTKEQLRHAIADSVEQHRLLVAERALLEGTLIGAVQALMDALAVVNPVAFGRAHRIRRLAIELARLAGCDRSWSLEAAALLSQLGYLSVPQEVLERVLGGRRLASTERRQLERVPAVACDLLRRIPRLEPVIKIISGLDAAFDSSHAELPTSTEILRLAADFDRYLVQIGDPQRAFEALQAHVARYSPMLIPLLRSHIGAERQTVAVREVRLDRVTAGMVLIQEVRTDTGALLVPADFEVTPGFLERLQNFPPGVGDRVVGVRVFGPTGPAPK
jgi:response regulator RpfG family c-di-GMP phosphodiesterase